jgi:hypothetical protein
MTTLQRPQLFNLAGGEQIDNNEPVVLVRKDHAKRTAPEHKQFAAATRDNAKLLNIRGRPMTTEVLLKLSNRTTYPVPVRARELVEEHPRGELPIDIHGTILSRM